MGSYVRLDRYKSGPRAGELKDEEDCRYWRMFADGKPKKGKKRNQRSKYFRGTFRQMKKALAAFETQVATENSKDMNFGKYVDEWMERREGIVSPTTYHRDKASARTMKYYLGEYKLSEITTEVLDDMYYTLVKDGGPSGKYPLKPSYIASIQSHVATVLHDAIRRGYLDKNPFEGAMRAKKRPEERKFPTGEELKSLLGKLDARSRHQIGVYLCACLGLRRGEAAGLRFQDITFPKDGEPGEVYVRKSLTLTYQLKTPKTTSSIRRLPMEDHLAEALEIRKIQVEADLRASKRAGLLDEIPNIDDVYVCCDEMGDPTSPVALTKWWTTYRKNYDMTDYTLHDLRHGFLTTAARTGVHPRVMMAIAGHSSPTLTLEIYSHANMEMKEQAFAAIAEILTPDSQQAALEEEAEIERLLAQDRGEETV